MSDPDSQLGIIIEYVPRITNMMLAHLADICCMSQAQGPVILEASPARGASTSLRASWVGNVADKGIEYHIITCCNKK